MIVGESWRYYASLYWANHYVCAVDKTLDNEFLQQLREKLYQFLRGNEDNAAFIQWIEEMSHLRIAFWSEGSGLGDRTPSPGAPKRKDYIHSRSPSRSPSCQPPPYIAAKLPRRQPGNVMISRQLWWSSALSYERDRTMFLSTWGEISNFPREHLHRGIRRIAFFASCANNFEEVIRDVCDINRCIVYHSHQRLSGLHLAARHGHLGIVRLLYKHGAKEDPDAPTTALHEASAGGHHSVVEYLLERLAIRDATVSNELPWPNINTQDENGRTALHIAAQYDRKDIVLLLLKQLDIDVNRQDWFRSTALHAAWKYSRDTVDILLNDARVNTTIKDVYGRDYCGI